MHEPTPGTDAWKEQRLRKAIEATIKRGVGEDYWGEIEDLHIAWDDAQSLLARIAALEAERDTLLVRAHSAEARASLYDEWAG